MSAACPPANFVHNGKTYLVLCPKCGRENHASCVPKGRCAWCGYEAKNEAAKDGKSA